MFFLVGEVVFVGLVLCVFFVFEMVWWLLCLCFCCFFFWWGRWCLLIGSLCFFVFEMVWWLLCLCFCCCFLVGEVVFVDWFFVFF